MCRLTLAIITKAGAQVAFLVPPNQGRSPAPAPPKKLTAYYTPLFSTRRGFKIPTTMPRARKINREKVLASLDAVCPRCGKVITPAEVRRIDFERIECPVCAERFAPSPRK